MTELFLKNPIVFHPNNKPPKTQPGNNNQDAKNSGRNKDMEFLSLFMDVVPIK